MTLEDRKILKQSGAAKTRGQHDDDGQTGPPAFPLAYTIEAAVAASNLTRSRIYQLMGTGELQARKAGRRTLILGESLRNYLENLPAANIRAPKVAA